ncbi:HLA class II histocompatibility antigen gamma chain isoform X1 [Mixophyes fleayi]|uniref:HLA class II histocompatibility antigen gamma chain isoform X1 n=1 Tax=Mixophyes fleayi TaxID=3061075 RepID=UPI003F4D71AA
MAEENQNLVQNEIPEENVVEVGNRGPRMSCNKGNMLTALSVFVGILIVGQAATVYFLTQQQTKITELGTTTNMMKLEALIKKLPGSQPARNKPKMRMASFNIPLVAEDSNNPTPNLEEIAKATNKIEDAAKYILLRGNPLRKYPTFNGTILDNMRSLKKSLSEEEWMVFDAWMQQWYLFYLVQNTKTPPSKGPMSTGDSGLLTSQETDLPAGLTGSRNLVFATTSYSTDSLSSFDDETPSGSPVLTPCQIKASSHAMPGTFLPQCDEKGDFTPMQCWRSTGFCWCVYQNGTEVPETRTRAKPDCSDIVEQPMKLDGFYNSLYEEKIDE